MQFVKPAALRSWAVVVLNGPESELLRLVPPPNDVASFVRSLVDHMRQTGIQVYGYTYLTHAPLCCTAGFTPTHPCAVPQVPDRPPPVVYQHVRHSSLTLTGLVREVMEEANHDARTTYRAEAQMLLVLLPDCRCECM